MIKDLLKEGFALKSSGHYKHAIEAFYKALEEDNSSCELLLEIADLYFQINNYERSIGYIEQVLKLEPTHVEALKLLKQIFIQKNGLNEAEQTAKNIYAITSKIEDLADILNLLNVQGKYEEVLSYDSYQCPKLMFEQGKSLFYMNKIEDAVELLQKTHSIEPNNREISLFLGKILYKCGKYKECISIAENLEFDKKNPDILNFCV